MKNLLITVMISYVLVGCGSESAESNKRNKRVSNSLNVEAGSLTCEESWENIKEYHRTVKYMENKINDEGRTSVESSETLAVTDSSVRIKTIYQSAGMEVTEPQIKIYTASKADYCNSLKEKKELEDLDKKEREGEKEKKLIVTSITVAAGKFNAEHSQVTSEKNDSVMDIWFIRISGENVIVKYVKDGETVVELQKLVLSK